MSEMRCPDELIDRQRSGELDASELAALEAHLASCASCRLERRLRADFAEASPPEPGDDALARRAIAQALGAPSVPQRRSRKRMLTLALAATLLLGLAAASQLGREPPEEAPPPAVERALEPAPVPLPPAPPAPSPSAAPAPPPEHTARAITSSSPAPAPSARARLESAAELYSRANAARRAGRTTDALDLYAELVRAHPGSREALTSRVAVARLLLDTRGDAARALREFDAYLAQAPNGTLGEEALAGRAQCLGTLGRSAEERAAWQELLRRFPDTVHRSRAERRLETSSAPD